MNKIIFILTLSAFLFSQQAEVINIQAAQRTDGSQIVDITYDLSEDAIFEFYQVTVEVTAYSPYQKGGRQPRNVEYQLPGPDFWRLSILREDLREDLVNHVGQAETARYAEDHSA